MIHPGQTAEATGFQNLRERLPAAEPYLFNLADQLVEAAPAADWNLIIGDDSSGRLPTYFIRHILAEAGHKIPTRFVAGSRVLHNELGLENYQKYFDWTVRSLGQSSVRALIMTESTASGGTMNFLRAGLAPYVDDIETAAVVNYYTNEFQTTYSGGQGKDASFDVFHAFESMSLTTLRSQFIMHVRKYIPQQIKDIIPANLKALGIHPANALLGLRVPADAHYPIARRHRNNPYSSQAYREMDVLVDKYVNLRARRTALATSIIPVQGGKQTVNL